MTRNRVFLFGVILFLLGSVAAFYRAGAVSAGSIKEPKAQDSRSNQVKIDTQVSVPANMEIMEAKSAIQVEADLSASETFEQLNQKALAAARSGWLHGKEHRKYDIDAPNFGVHPNGMAIPTEKVKDFWFYISAEGFIERSVMIVRNVDGGSVEVGINSEGTTWSTATDEIVSHELFPWGYGFDFGLHYYLDSPDLQYDVTFDQNGKPSVNFTITIHEDTPSVSDEYRSPVVAMDHYYSFDAETGFLTRMRTVAHLADGSQRDFVDIQVEFFTGAEPPPEVLAYFEQKRVREEDVK